MSSNENLSQTEDSVNGEVESNKQLVIDTDEINNNTDDNIKVEGDPPPDYNSAVNSIAQNGYDSSCDENDMITDHTNDSDETSQQKLQQTDNDTLTNTSHEDPTNADSRLDANASDRETHPSNTSDEDIIADNEPHSKPETETNADADGGNDNISAATDDDNVGAGNTEGTQKVENDDIDSEGEEVALIPDPPEYEQQKSEIQAHLQQHLQSGQKWYLIHVRWFKHWKRYVGYDSWDRSNVGEERAKPGPIDNLPLMENEKLRRHQVDEIDYKLVPQEAWRKLASWYGVVPGSVAISRRVVEYGKYVKQCKVEIYPLELKTCVFPNENDFKIVRISRCDTINVLLRKIINAFELDPNAENHIYNRYMTYTYELISNLTLEAQDVGLFDGQYVLVELKNSDGSWPRANQPIARSTQTSSISSSSGVTTRSSSGIHTSSWGGSMHSNYSYMSGYRQKTTPGLCGLSNLGNTCFMNSGLQCLSHIPKVVEYFKSGEYEKEINRDNPLGMQGELAKAYGELIKDMWSGDYSYIAPRNYKITVGKFAPAFSGYAQHDSQEHLSFLLDGLHEDLNRIKKKPYIEMKEFNGSDEDAANEAWEIHLKRNKSVIVDTFQGQYKSTLVCPVCNKISITFDPFMYLSLPLPIKQTRSIRIILVRLDPEQIPRQYKLKVPKNGCVLQLCQELSVVSGIDVDKLVVCDVYNHRFHKVFHHKESLSGITDRDDIYVYETPIADTNDPDYICLPVYCREIRRTYYTMSNQTYIHPYLFGLPLIIPVKRNTTTYTDLYRRCLYYLKRYIVPDVSLKNNIGDTNSDNEKDEEKNNSEGENDDIETNSKGTNDDNDAINGNVSDANNSSTSGVSSQTVQQTLMETGIDSGNRDNDNNTDNINNSNNSTTTTNNNDNNNNDNNNNNNNNTNNNNNNNNNMDNANCEDGNSNSDSDENANDSANMELNPTQAEDSDNKMEIQEGATPIVSPIADVPQNFDDSVYPNDLFIIKLVNSYGSNDLGSLRDDQNPLRLDSRCTLCLEWNSNFRGSYNDNELRNIQLDETIEKKEPKREIQLSDCIDLFTKKEILSADDPWYCPKCAEFRRASKQLQLWKIPDCLVIHLKRFSYNAYWRDKLDTFVNCPSKMDLKDICLLPTQGSLTYHLIAVSNHYGGLGGGHYTAYAKHHLDQKWFDFDDSSVSSHVNEDSVITKAAYLLFYIRESDSVPPQPLDENAATEVKKEAIDGSELSEDPDSTPNEEIDQCN